MEIQATRSRPYDALKRVLDVVGAVVGLVVLSPFLALGALAVAIDLGRPILFSQTRIGRGGKPFIVRKLRTMRATDEVSVAAVASDSERLSAVGRFLRATSIDELPEMANILTGDMSWVGPRPLLPEYLPLYSPEQARRHEVRPGLTGLAQVSGRNAVDWEERFALDVEYVDRRSLALDLAILARTVGAVFSRRGVSDGTTATMEPFRGSAVEPGDDESTE